MPKRQTKPAKQSFSTACQARSKCHGVKGTDANVGLSKYAGIVFEKDSALAARFLQNEHP